MGKVKRVAIYTRVSTGEQTTANQAAELKAWAERSGHPSSRSTRTRASAARKGRDKRPAFDAMLKAAVRARLRHARRVVLGSLGPLVAASDRGPANHPRHRHRALHPHPIARHDDAGGARDVRYARRVRRVRAGDDRRPCQRGPRPRAPSGTKSGKAIGRPKGADFDRKAIRAALLKGRIGSRSRARDRRQHRDDGGSSQGTR